MDHRILKRNCWADRLMVTKPRFSFSTFQMQMLGCIIRKDWRHSGVPLTVGSPQPPHFQIEWSESQGLTHSRVVSLAHTHTLSLSLTRPLFFCCGHSSYFVLAPASILPLHTSSTWYLASWSGDPVRTGGEKDSDWWPVLFSVSLDSLPRRRNGKEEKQAIGLVGGMPPPAGAGSCRPSHQQTGGAGG